MNEYISKIENGKYELVVRCGDYKDFKSFESLIREEMARISNKKSEPGKICDAENSCIGKNFTACSDEFKNRWRSVIKEVSEKIKAEKECRFSDIVNKNKDMQYADIYEMFDSIFAWLEKFYLGDNCYFIVSRTGATFHRDGGLTILPENFRKRIYPKDNSTNKNETK